MNFGVVVAGGQSKRMGPTVDKAFFTLGSRPVLAYSLMAFERCASIDGVILVARKDKLEAATNLVQMFGCAKVKKVVAGGARRQDSVANGLAELGDDVDIVAVHDGGRPLVSPKLIADTVESARRHGSGVAAVPMTDTVKVVERGMVVTRTMDRTKLWTVQTPQTFSRALLVRALETVAKKRATVTDEASAVELIGEKVYLVPSDASNIKITTPADIPIALALLSGVDGVRA